MDSNQNISQKESGFVPPQSGTMRKSSLGQMGLFFVGGLVLGGMLSAGFFLNRASKQATSTADVVGETLLTVDGTTYTSANLPTEAAMAYYQLESSIYDAKLNFTNQIALRLALSKDNPKADNASGSLPTLDALLSIPEVTDAEVKDYYNSIVARYGQSVLGGQTLDSLKPQLKQQLTRQKYDQTINTKIQELASTGRIVALLTKPVSPPVNLNLVGYPTRGNEKAVVTLVEVADYMCPHCRETEPAIEKIYKEFGDKVKFVQVSFPLNVEGLNGALARGAYCASQQGQTQFWSYHKNAFQVDWSKMKPSASDAASAGKFFNSEATAVAQNSGLDMTAFNSCLGSNEAQAHIERMKKDFNSEVGFQGTPAFYLNNRLVQANPSQLEETLRKALTQLN